METESIPLDPKDPRPISFAGTGDLWHQAQLEVLPSDILKERQTFDSDTIGYMERDPTRHSEDDAWRFKGRDPRTHPYFSELMEIMTVPVKGGLVKAHIRPHYGKDHIPTGGVDVGDERIMTATLKTRNSGRGSKRTVLEVGTDHGRRLLYDPMAPDASGNPDSMGSSPLVASSGCTELVQGYTGRHLWNFEARQWVAEREARGQFEQSYSDLQLQLRQPPEPYHEIHYIPPPKAATASAR